MAQIKLALVSVADKNGIVPFCQELAELGVRILSTGGTAALLRQQGIPVQDVADHTGFPEMLEGRVKTLHPKIHGGLLGLRANPEHQEQMRQHQIEPIDLVVVNLYPFAATVAKPGCTLEEAIEQIDIGGPTMLRSAAKNHQSVTVICDPADYATVAAELRASSGSIAPATNFRLARKVFAHTAAYDGAISNWLGTVDLAPEQRLYPPVLTLQFHKAQEMRYGENPHQSAAFYVDPQAAEAAVSRAEQLQGKELSFNNVNDANGAVELAREFTEPVAVIVKHTNPCGVAVDSDLTTAYRRARAADPVSAFGGIIAVNRPVEEELAREIAATFVEAVIAPEFTPAAQAVLAAKKSLRLLRIAGLGSAPPGAIKIELKPVVGGMLVQERDLHQLDPAALRVVTERAPTPRELEDLLFGWLVAKHVKSNAIVYASGRCTVGVGAGQMSRVDASRIAIWKAREIARAAGVEGDPIRGSVVASDAFFPFRDGVDAAAEAGAVAVIQPGGSVRDEEVIAAANEHGMAMVFTGVRHFRH